VISIIVPIYNSEKWIKKCIESLVNQTYRDIEILLINDGSKDKSLEICKDYAEKDRRIVVIDKENEGVSATRNLGIKKSKGEYIQFVDSDDYIEPCMCEKLIAAIVDVDMVLCGMRVWKNGVVLREPHLDNGVYNFKDNVDTYFILRKINLGPCNKLFRKKLIFNGFKEGLSLGEDALFLFDYMRKVDKVSVLSDCLYNVVLDNENSLNRKSKIDKIDLLIDQRKTEEQFLLDVYGRNCDFVQMYNNYLLTIHAWLLEVVRENSSMYKEIAHIYINNVFLQSKLRCALPDRIDYKIFKYLYIKKYVRLIYLYFKLKIISNKLKK